MLKPLAAEQKNTLFGAFAIVLWAFAALFAVELTAIPAFQLFFLQFLIAFIVVLIRYLASSEKSVFFQFRIRDLLITSFALIVNQSCYYIAFRYSEAADVDLINYLWPTLLVVFSPLLPKERCCPSSCLACLLSLWGVYYLLSPNYSTPFSPDHLVGYVLAFGAALSWTLYSLYTRYQSSNSANCISWSCGIAALMSLTLHLLTETFVAPTLYEGALICIVGTFQVGLAFYFWERALKRGHLKFLSLASYGIPILSISLLVLFGKADFTERLIVATMAITAAPLIPLVYQRISLRARS